MADRAPATEYTKAANDALADQLPFEDRQDFDDATRGFIAPLPDGGTVRDAEGRTVWDPDRYAFITDDAPCPDTVNPSLWRQSQLCMKGGLFQVTDRLYQVRNQDLSNLTIVEGDTGIIVFDPLISVETARAALELYYAHRPRKPVVALLYSHSHVDHYGGAKGIISAEDAAEGRVRVIAPEGFLQAAVSENVMAGTAMARRASYMYGSLLPADAQGQVGAGLGMTTSAGTISLIAPNETVTHTGQRLDIDGLTFEFMLAPDTEAPAEMHWFIEELGALTAAENCCHTLHNTYTLRGAPIRDPHAWAHYLNETIDRWAERSTVMYGMHHWPVWGPGRVLDMLRKGRDAYRYINDETLRLANKGLTAIEIAEEVRLPDALDHHWAIRGYYGTVNHNVKATYVKYLGWFDGNPAHLHELPPTEAAARYVELMGGAETVLERARAAYDQGEYRWVAQLVDHVVFAEPTNQAARALQAATLEQLGYQSESGPWRNFYLTGAQELRHGPPTPSGTPAARADVVQALTVSQFFDYLAIRLDGPRAAEAQLRINFHFTDTDEHVVLELAHGTLNHSPGRTDADADATVTLTRHALNQVMVGAAQLPDLMASGTITVTPGLDPLITLFGLLDRFDPWFAIVEP